MNLFRSSSGTQTFPLFIRDSGVKASIKYDLSAKTLLYYKISGRKLNFFPAKIFLGCEDIQEINWLNKVVMSPKSRVVFGGVVTKIKIRNK